jgi:hypothetical protein
MKRKLCQMCGGTLSAKSIFYCDACASYHAGYQARFMSEKRARSPEYRADEREKVRARMRAIRAQRRQMGLNKDGKPFKSDVWKRRALEGISA